MKLRSRSDDTCQLDMYTIQSFHTPYIVNLLHKYKKNRQKHKNFPIKKKMWYDCQ